MRARFLAILAAAALACVGAAAPALADTGDDPIGQSVDDAIAQGQNEIPVIIFVDGDAAAVRAALPADAATEDLPVIDAVSTTLSPAEIADLAASGVAPLIDEIQTDDDVVGLGWADYLSFTNLAIGLDGVVPPQGGGPTGEGVNVAVLDSGVDAHQDLGGADGLRLIVARDFIRQTHAAGDGAGHGTFVAGLIAGNGSASLPVDQGGQANRQYRGVAPEAGIVSLKVLDSSGSGRESDVLRAIGWAIKNRVRYNIRVLNVSLGADVMAPAEYDPMALAVEAAWKSGIVVVAAAGNEGEFGPGGILSPANDPNIITVGAMDTGQTARRDDDIICSYSSMGPTLFDEYAKPDVVAPGNRNISLRVPGSYVDTNWPQNQIPVADYLPGAPADAAPQYFKLSGTSTSAPVVSGIVALMLDKDPTLTPDDIKLRLMKTADPLPDVSELQQGAGQVDVPAAMASSLVANEPTLSEDLGTGTTILPAHRYVDWDRYKWTRYKWTRYKWTRYKWTGVNWARYKWTGIDWTRYKWTGVDGTRYKWTGVDWTRYKWTGVNSARYKWTGINWTRYKWTGIDWTRYKWTGVDGTRYKWTDYEWARYKWTLLIEGQ
jgi:serine protease AprX